VSIRPVMVLTTRVLPVAVEEAGSVVAAWASEARGRAVCAANVHMVMEAWDDAGFSRALNGADLTVCDGRPVVWACLLEGVGGARQTRGSDLMDDVCRRAARRGLRVGLYGSAPDVLGTVRRRLLARHPGLQVSYCCAPPFRELSAAEDEAVMQAIADAGVQVLFVSLGCPKQERWMFAHRERMACVALGVGAAFDMVAGVVVVAPRWAQVLGLEWAFRLVAEPRRLWRRYALHNGRFVVLVAREWLARRRRARGAPHGR